jgi:hypothetical protein
MAPETHSAQEKALQINLEAQRLGTFAEIGAGQEVARWFFHAGKASATVAKSISAYDMAISDALYGPTGHYVSRPRLESMLDCEYGQLAEGLGAARIEGRRLFAFADTVATHSSPRHAAGHGWLGIRFQAQAGAEPSQIIAHIEMLDRHTANQQEAVGLAGVNLLYGAFYRQDNPGSLIGTLLDGLGRQRLEVDMIKFSGPAFQGLDNRLMSLQLVEQGLTDAAMFTDRGEVVQPAEILSQRPVLIERGNFRPITKVVRDVLDRAREQLQEDGKLENPVVLMEMTLRNLMAGHPVDHQDFLARVDILGALGYLVMISNYTTFDRVTQYLRNYTRQQIGMAVGIPILREIFDEKYYTDLNGGLLEGLGRLFSGEVKLLVYPTIEPGTGDLTTAETVAVADRLKHLYLHLRENGFIESIRRFDAAHLQAFSSSVLAKLQAGDPDWENMVPAQAVRLIKEKGLFGYSPAAPAL